MTTATAQPSVPVPSPARRSTHSNARLGFAGLVRSQWIALSSLRGNVAALIIGIVATAGLATAFAAMISYSHESSGGQTLMPEFTTLGVNTFTIALIVAVLPAVALYAKEHSTGANRTLLAVAPRRAALIGAKAVVIAAVTFAAAFVAMALSMTGVAVVFGAFGNPLGIDSFGADVVLPAVGAAFYIAACSVFALAAAALLRSETWAILLVLVYLLMLPTVLMMLPFDWAPVVSEYLLSTSGEQLVAPFTGFSADLFADLALTVAWPAVALVAAMAVDRSRDA